MTLTRIKQELKLNEWINFSCSCFFCISPSLPLNTQPSVLFLRHFTKQFMTYCCHFIGCHVLEVFQNVFVVFILRYFHKCLSYGQDLIFFLNRGVKQRHVIRNICTCVKKSHCLDCVWCELFHFSRHKCCQHKCISFFFF